MVGISHNFGEDLTLGPSGDLATASGSDLGRQSVLRRLLTNPGAYIWHLDYGAGLGAFVGKVNPRARLQAVARQQIKREAAVASSPAPVTTVEASAIGVLTLTIHYTDAQTGANQTIAVPVS